MIKGLRWFSTEGEEIRLLETKTSAAQSKKRSVQDILDSSDSSDNSETMAEGEEREPTLREVLSAIQKMDAEVKNISTTVGELKGEIHLLHLENDNVKKELDEIRSENEYLHSKIRELETKIDLVSKQSSHNAQYSRRNNLRIFGVKEATNENVIQVVTNLVKTKLKIQDFTANDIDAAHRVGDFDKGDDPKPRGIIVRFVRRIMRDRIIKARKALAGSRMAITDDLTKANMQLLAQVKAHKDVESAWPQDCRILVCMKKSKKIATVTSVAHLNENAEKWSNWKKKIPISQQASSHSGAAQTAAVANPDEMETQETPA